MANADDVKEMIRKRLEERKAAAAGGDVPTESPEEDLTIEEIIQAELDEDGGPEPDEEEFELTGDEDFVEEDLWEPEDSLSAWFEEGRQAYYNGLNMEEIPFKTEDFEDDGYAAVVVEAWNEGWFAAHGETWTATVLLAARDLIRATTEEEMTKAITEITQGVEVLEDGVVNFDDLAEEFRPA